LGIPGEESVVIDFDKEVQSLGLEVVKVSEKVLAQSGELRDFCYMKKGKVVSLINLVRDLLGYLRNSMEDFVRTH
jgi:hypothetical protein